MEQILQDHLVKATSVVEQQLDAEIDRLDKLDDDDIEKIREKRMKALRKIQAQKQVCLKIIQ